MNWNLTVEHQLSKDVLMKVGYVASKGTHLAYNTDVNAPLPSPTATADNEDDRRPISNLCRSRKINRAEIRCTIPSRPKWISGFRTE